MNSLYYPYTFLYVLDPDCYHQIFCLNSADVLQFNGNAG